MVVNENLEWDIGEDIDESWFYDVESERREEENRISNDDFLIHHATDEEFRAYIVKELNNIKSSLSSI